MDWCYQASQHFENTVAKLLIARLKYNLIFSPELVIPYDPGHNQDLLPQFDYIFSVNVVSECALDVEMEGTYLAHSLFLNQGCNEQSSL